MILFLDTDGTILEVSRSATGLPQQHIVHRPVYDFVPAESHEPLREAIESVLQTNRVATLEVRFVRRFGQPSWQLMRLGPIQSHGRTTGLVLLASDITQHKLAIQKLQAEEDLLRDLLELQDRERRMVAYEIHDGFIQDVVGARMMLQGLRRCLPEQDSAVIRRFDSAVSLLAHAVNEGRRLISELRPMIIDEMGIVDAIEFLIGEEEARGGMEITFVRRMQRTSCRDCCRRRSFASRASRSTMPAGTAPRRGPRFASRRLARSAWFSRSRTTAWGSIWTRSPATATGWPAFASGPSCLGAAPRSKAGPTRGPASPSSCPWTCLPTHRHPARRTSPGRLDRPGWCSVTAKNWGAWGRTK